MHGEGGGEFLGCVGMRKKCGDDLGGYWEENGRGAVMKKKTIFFSSQDTRGCTKYAIKGCIWQRSMSKDMRIITYI